MRATFRAPRRPALAAAGAVLALAALGGCAGNDPRTAADRAAAPPAFQATIQRTAFGVPHVTAPDLRGAAYGVAYAYAQDNLCLLADQLLTVAGERSRHLGPDAPVRPGSALSNLRSDFVHRFLLQELELRRAQDRKSVV